jgi:hypothetical protein
MPRRTFLRSRQPPPRRAALEQLDIGQLGRKQDEYNRGRTAFLAAGALSGIVAMVIVGSRLWEAIRLERQNKKSAQAKDAKTSNIQLDSATPTETYTTDGDTRRKVVIHDDEGRELVPTGNSTVPMFPRTVVLPATGSASPASPIAAAIGADLGTEYTLVGLGLRSVSFIGIQVYVVGFYVATSDVAALQAYLVKKINPTATTLVAPERDALRSALLDPAEGEGTWDTILRESGCRSAFRIVPVRDTDFHHLRDGFVRSIAGRSQHDASQYGDEAFANAVKDFRGLFNRGSVPRRKELVLCRDRDGRLTVLYSDGKTKGQQLLGEVADERVSRLLWLNYLAGKKVASEPARQSIIDGVMEFVERPIGTVASQVV